MRRPVILFLIVAIVVAVWVLPFQWLAPHAVIDEVTVQLVRGAVTFWFGLGIILRDAYQRAT